MLHDREAIIDHINRLAKQLTISVELFTYTDGEELLHEYPKELDLLFLDVQMAHTNGMKAAALLRQFDTSVTLIFMTNYSQYAVQGYAVQAYQYLIKPVTYADFSRELSSIFIKLELGTDKRLYLQNDEGLFSVPLKNIIYIETTLNKRVVVHAEKKAYKALSPLSKIEANLPDDYFYRCHNSIIVNFNFIREIEKEWIIMNNAEKVPISRRRRKGFLEAFMAYAGGLL